jgi:diguanylate cyclase (GGDEF)-like protein
MRSLRTQILLLAALLVVITQAGTIGTFLFTANREVRQQARDGLVSSTAMLERLLQLRADQMQNTMRVLAGNGEFIAALASNDRATVSAALERAVAGAEASVAVVLDSQGRVLGGSYGDDALPVALPAVVRRAAEQGAARATVHAGGRVYELATVPLAAGDAVPREWLSMGLALDDARARRLAEVTGLDIAFLADGTGATQILGTSLSGVEAPVVGAALRGPREDPSGTFAVTVGGRDYLAAARPLVRGTAGASVLLLRSVDDALAPYRTLRLSAALLGLLAMAVALGGAAVVARALTGPVRELARAALRIRNGDYGEPVAVPADGEMGMLAAALNTMQAGIAEREGRITWQARFDRLTGLPNRLLALEQLREAVETAGPDGSVSVLVIDLGSLGNVASALGHEICDALLMQAAERLRAGVDARHTVARLEGDEFLVVLGGLDLDGARDVAGDLLRLLGIGLAVRDVNISLDVSIGVATFPVHGREPDQLLLRASVAKNDARAARQPLHVYQDGREERRVRQLAILGDLRRAVHHDELKLYMQPKVALPGGAVCGAEALVRWEHRTLGWLQPGEFIGVAEQFGNISLVTHWALATAVRECRLWLEEGHDVGVSVNLSSRDLLDRNLPVFVTQLLRDHDLAAGYLTLEITEEALVRDFAGATLVLQCLRELGVRVSIDDFGTGYSSLAQIRHLPVDEIKIDRTFVMSLPQDRQDAAIVRAAIDLAHSLGLEVVAEGVEAPPALRWLAAHGCERAQGFLVSRPMPAEAFGEWLTRYRHAATGGGARLAVATLGAG